MSNNNIICGKDMLNDMIKPQCKRARCYSNMLNFNST